MFQRRLILVALASLMASPAAYRCYDRLMTKAPPVDAAMAQEGKVLFDHEWTPNDPLAGGGDGLGPVFNANSCVACHRQGGGGGGGPRENNVHVFTVRPNVSEMAAGGKARQGVVHTQAVGPTFQESFGHVHPEMPIHVLPISVGPVFQPITFSGNSLPRGVDLSQRNTPALFGAGLIDAIPDSDIIANERAQRLKWGLATSQSKDLPVGRALRMADGRIGRFGWKAQTVRLADFVRAACANELGLGNPGQAQPQPLGFPSYQPRGLDLTDAQCDQLTQFIVSLPRPVERTPLDADLHRKARAGKSLFARIGCTHCHVADVGNVRGMYSDLLLHDMGQETEAGGNYTDQPLEEPAFKPGSGPFPAEWRTPPLWGVARSAPYMHDGRAVNLEHAISMHGGQGAKSAHNYASLPVDEQAQVIAFLMTLDTP
ncbi:MAG: c-type cytochrome [Planctomycetia bacterium]|nr:c-type cytochrome [Planctomycetia bacterium]